MLSRHLDDDNSLGQLCLPLQVSSYLDTLGRECDTPGGIIHQRPRRH